MKNWKNVAIIALAVIIVVGGVYWVWIKKGGSSSEYGIVYLTNGETYVGKLSRFPKVSLEEAYQLQVVKPQASAEGEEATTPAKPSFQLVPIKEALWATDKVSFNDDNIVFTATLRTDSKIYQALSGANKP